MAGVQEVNVRQDRFPTVGELEQAAQEKLNNFDKETETDSLANQSYYGMLHEDMASFKTFYNRGKTEEQRDYLIPETDEVHEA